MMILLSDCSNSFYKEINLKDIIRNIENYNSL